MKRKIAAILAADIAGYSRLIAEDEEETLRRLAAYRSVFDDFVKRHEGRIFNTAGDAVLAEFSSSVEAVRCAIDIQESLRTRNLAYPPSRQMNFRIGITLGDVVERDGDLLGDGVNIAARLEGLAPPGGICISQAVREQVANKLSVPISDIGEQEVKNIPTPVHAYIVGSTAGSPAVAAARSTAKAAPAASRGVWLSAGAVAAAAVLAAGAWLWQARAPAPAEKPATTASLPTAAPPAPTQVAVAAPAASPAPRALRPLIADQVPLVSRRHHTIVQNEYLPAKDKKALAISPIRIGMATGHDQEETAKTAALESCNTSTKATRPDLSCELYAVGTNVVHDKGPPPMPPEPWLSREPAIESPFAIEQVPIVNHRIFASAFARYTAGKKHRAIAISGTGHVGFYFDQSNVEEAVRRALQFCGFRAGVPCRIVAVDDVFVVPMPSSVKITGFFNPRISPTVAAEHRDSIASRLANNPGGWSAVAAGGSGKAGVAVKAASEQAAIESAAAECGQRDHGCRLIALGPWSVAPK
jgi:adenylate cyclase